MDLTIVTGMTWTYECPAAVIALLHLCELVTWEVTAFSPFTLLSLQHSRCTQSQKLSQLKDWDQMVKCTKPNHVPLQFLLRVSQQYAMDVTLLQKNEVNILIKWRQGWTQCRYLSQVTPHPSMISPNRNSARYTFNVHTHSCSLAAPGNHAGVSGAIFPCHGQSHQQSNVCCCRRLAICTILVSSKGVQC
jgi:hypothetical protein